MVTSGAADGIIQGISDHYGNILDNAGSLLPTFYTSLGIGVIIDALGFEKFGKYAGSLIGTIGATATEYAQQHAAFGGTFDENDVYAVLLGGTASACVGIISEISEKRKKKRVDFELCADE